MNLLNLPNDILREIGSKDINIWILLAIYSDNFYNYTKINTTLFIRIFTVKTVNSLLGDIFYTIFGKLHCIDGPAHVSNRNNKYVQCWYHAGKLHRDNDLPAIEHDNFKIWFQNGKRHRSNDLPAVEYTNGRRFEWYRHDRRHRDGDLPAIIDKCTKTRWREWWYKNGKLHRDNGPAIIECYHDMWYQGGKLHRDNDLPAFIARTGIQKWYQNGELHRDNDLPAVISPFYKEWYQYGMRHRENDQPAYINLLITWKSDYLKIWYYNNVRHRENDLPAVIYNNGEQKWYHKGYFVRVECNKNPPCYRCTRCK